jgi:hypothetical protein
MTETKNNGVAPIDFILRHVFKLDPGEVRAAIGRVWRIRFGLRADPGGPTKNIERGNLLAIGVRPENEAAFEAMFERVLAHRRKMAPSRADVSVPRSVGG